MKRPPGVGGGGLQEFEGDVVVDGVLVGAAALVDAEGQGGAGVSGDHAAACNGAGGEVLFRGVMGLFCMVGGPPGIESDAIAGMLATIAARFAGAVKVGMGGGGSDELHGDAVLEGVFVGGAAHGDVQGQGLAAVKDV